MTASFTCRKKKKRESLALQLQHKGQRQYAIKTGGEPQKHHENSIDSLNIQKSHACRCSEAIRYITDDMPGHPGVAGEGKPKDVGARQRLGFPPWRRIQVPLSRDALLDALLGRTLVYTIGPGVRGGGLDVSWCTPSSTPDPHGPWLGVRSVPVIRQNLVGLTSRAA